MSDPDLSALTVRAEWDSEAGVWVAESGDVLGLVMEAETLDQLVERLRTLVPELLALSGAARPTVSIELVTENPGRAEVRDRLQRDAALVREHVSTVDGDRFVDAALADLTDWRG